MSVAVRETASTGAFRPRPVFCVTDHLGRDRAVAEDVCAGRFTELGLTLDLGREPDWTGAGFPADEEWQIAWGKFYWGLDLAAAFGESGEKRFQEAWERLVRSWLGQVPTGQDSTDTVARRLLNWVYAWNRFADAPGFIAIAHPLTALIVDSMTVQSAWLRRHLTPARNHRTLELYALFIVALAFPQLQLAAELEGFALAELAENLRTDFRSDGVHVEASTHYHLIALRSFVGLRENSERFGLALPGDFDSRLERALEFAMHCHRPDGLIPALSDSDSGSYAELLELGAKQLDRPDFLYVATRGRRGVPPHRGHVSFPAGGYHIQRSGWGGPNRAFEQERFLIFDCGPLGEGGHGHYDLLSVELAADGRALVLDPGRYTYHEGDPNLRRWFKGTAAHNTICVDGLDQTQYFRGKPKGPVAEGVFLGRHIVPGLDVLWGAAASPRYDVRHERRVLFVAGEYWLFEDRLWSEHPHRYDQRWHLAPAANGAVVISSDERGASVRTPGLTLGFAPGGDVRLEAGWYAPAYGIKHPAPVVSVGFAAAGNASLLTVAAPTVDGSRAPALRDTVSDAESVSVQVEGVGALGEACDTVTWSLDGATASWERAAGGVP